MDELLKLARILDEASDELDKLKAGIDNVKKDLNSYLEKIHDKGYTDNIYKRVDDGEISPLQALNEAKTTWKTKQIADKTRQADGQNNADIQANISASEYYQGSDWDFNSSYENLHNSNISGSYEEGSPQSSSKSENKNVNSAPAEVYQGSDWENQLEQFDRGKSDAVRSYGHDNLNANNASDFSTNSGQTDAEPNANWSNNAASENSGGDTNNYSQNNNPQPWANNSQDQNSNSNLARNSNESDTGQNGNNQQNRKTENTYTVPSANFEPKQVPPSNAAASGRQPSLRSQRKHENLNHGSSWDSTSATSDGAVVTARRDQLIDKFHQGQQPGNNSSTKDLGIQAGLSQFDISDDYRPFNSNKQTVNSEYDNSYNTSDIEYSDSSPLNTDDQQETLGSTGSTVVSPSATQYNNTVLKDSSTQTNETNYSNDVEDSTGYNDYSPLNSDNQNMGTYPNAQFRNQSSNSDSEDFDDEFGSDSTTVEIRHTERFDNNNSASADDSSATQNSNTGLEQTNQKSMSSKATQTNPADLDEQSQNYNLNSTANEHSSNQSETNQKLDQSYNSASNQATDTSKPKNTSAETHPDDFQNPDGSSLSRPGSFDSSISQSSSASSDVPTKAPEIHPLDVICNTLEERTKNKEEIITAKALFKKYKMGGKFVRNMLRAFPLPELVQKNPEVEKAVDDLVNYLSNPRNKLTKDQKYLKAFFARRGYGSKN